MKAMCKRAENNRARIEHEERERKRKEFLDSLTEEERQEFLAKEKERQSKAMKLFASVLGVASAMGVENTYGGIVK